MAKDYAQVKDFVVADKVDCRQGSEFRGVIADLTRTEGSRFLRLKSRLNVMFSRAKDCLIVIANKKGIDALNKREGKILQKFQTELMKWKRHQSRSESCKYCSPGQVDLVNARDALENDFDEQGKGPDNFDEQGKEPNKFDEQGNDPNNVDEQGKEPNDVDEQGKEPNDVDEQGKEPNDVDEDPETGIEGSEPTLEQVQVPGLTHQEFELSYAIQQEHDAIRSNTMHETTQGADDNRDDFGDGQPISNESVDQEQYRSHLANLETAKTQDMPTVTYESEIAVENKTALFDPLGHLTAAKPVVCLPSKDKYQLGAEEALVEAENLEFEARKHELKKEKFEFDAQKQGFEARQAKEDAERFREVAQLAIEERATAMKPTPSTVLTFSWQSDGAYAEHCSAPVSPDYFGSCTNSCVQLLASLSRAQLSRPLPSRLRLAPRSKLRRRPSKSGVRVRIPPRKASTDGKFAQTLKAAQAGEERR